MNHCLEVVIRLHLNTGAYHPLHDQTEETMSPTRFNLFLVRNLEKVVSIRSCRKLFVHEGIVLKAMSGNLEHVRCVLSKNKRYLLVPFPVVKVESTDLSLFLNLKRKSILGFESEMGSLRAAGSAFQYGRTAALRTV